MIVYINDKNEIKDVNSTNDSSLTPIELNDETNPFKDWSTARILCYKIEVLNGEIISMYPYIDTRLLDVIELMGSKLEQQVANLDYISMMSGINIPSEEE